MKGDSDCAKADPGPSVAEKEARGLIVEGSSPAFGKGEPVGGVSSYSLVWERRFFDAGVDGTSTEDEGAVDEDGVVESLKPEDQVFYVSVADANGDESSGGRDGSDVVPESRTSEGLVKRYCCGLKVDDSPCICSVSDGAISSAVLDAVLREDSIFNPVKVSG